MTKYSENMLTLSKYYISGISLFYQVVKKYIFNEMKIKIK